MTTSPRSQAASAPPPGPVVLDVTPDLVARWADVVDDHNPLHLDPQFAAGTPFGAPIAHGSLVFALACDAAQAAGAGDGTLAVRFTAPVPVGSRLVVGTGPDGAPDVRCGADQPVRVTLTRRSTS
ncbi:MaoC family dehydratase [Angustibacter sp. Root456]|uniref:MaoC family dehydratase n=1 Tax=Angustibacter sp. Root456 TaxID=1736539 RepID=UPI0006FDEAD1|nr:MaoC family dehydratase [Angustibacter sp. Root456]KQX62816.1 hypothetical protein ASD06_12400 [Angustibacter sp. Root456]